MNELDWDELAGMPCPGCGIGDQLEIHELGGIVIDGQVYHTIECKEEADNA
jgi:hypothetical protein